MPVSQCLRQKARLSGGSFNENFWRRGAHNVFQVRFVEMPVINAIHSGAKTILAYFHYACKGQRPFSLDHDWDTDEAKNMARLDNEQVGFLKKYQHQIHNNGREPDATSEERTDGAELAQVQAVSYTHDYEKEYWFVGQMFDAAWVPRETKEDLLPA